MRWRRFGLGGGIALAIGLLVLFRHLLAPFVVALALAYLLDPLLDRLEAHGYSRVGTIGLVYGTFFLLFLLGILFIVPTLVNQVNALVQNFDSYVNSLQKITSGWSRQADRWVGKLPVAAEQKEKIHRYLEELRNLWGEGAKPAEKGSIGTLTPLQWVPLEGEKTEGPSKGAIVGQVTRGRVSDGRFVVVWVEKPFRATTTNEEGHYELTNLEPGTYTVQACYGDLWQTFPHRVEVRAGFKTTSVDLALATRSRLNLTGVATWVVDRLKVFLQRLIDSLSSLLSFFLLLPITTFYFLRDYDPLRRRLFVLVPEGNRPMVADLAGQINRILGGYLRGQFLVCSLVGLMATGMLFLWSLVFGTKYWLFLGLLTGLLSVIPYFGMPTAAILIGITSYLTGDWRAALAALLSILAINLVSDNFLSPRIIGRQVGLHPLILIFALLAGGSLFGVVGMIVSGPVVASLKAVVVHFWPALTDPLPPEIAPPPPPPRRWRWPRRRPRQAEKEEQVASQGDEGGGKIPTPNLTPQRPDRNLSVG